MNVAELQNWSFLSGRTAAIDNLLNMASVKEKSPMKQESIGIKESE